MAGSGKRNVVKTPDWPATRNNENNLFLTFLFTRRAGMHLHRTTEDYNVPPQIGGTRKSVLVGPRILRGATLHPALCAIFGQTFSSRFPVNYYPQKGIPGKPGMPRTFQFDNSA